MKKKLEYYEYPLYTDKEYSIQEITDIIENEISERKRCGYVEISDYKLFSDTECDYSGNYARFVIKFYREETDQEYADRLSNEEFQRLKNQERNKKRLLAKQKREEEKELKIKMLMENPDYEKFLLMKEKFAYLENKSKKNG